MDRRRETGSETSIQWPFLSTALHDWSNSVQPSSNRLVAGMFEDAIRIVALIGFLYSGLPVLSLYWKWLRTSRHSCEQYPLDDNGNPVRIIFSKIVKNESAGSATVIISWLLSLLHLSLQRLFSLPFNLAYCCWWSQFNWSLSISLLNMSVTK